MADNLSSDIPPETHGTVPPPAGPTPPFPTPPFPPPAPPDPAPTGADDGTSRRRRWRRAVASVGAAVVVAVGAFFGAQALGSHSSASPSTISGTGAPAGRAGAFGPGTSGTVTSVNAGGLTLTDQNGSTVTVTTSASTTISKTTAGTLGDIQSGDHVMVFASGNAPALTATRITDSGTQAPTGPRGGAGAGGANRAGTGTPGGAAGTVVQGTVATNDGSTMAVTESNGTTVSVAVNASTPVSVTRAIPLSGIAVGDTVRVRGTGSSTVAATSITDGASGFGGFGRGGNGAAGSNG